MTQGEWKVTKWGDGKLSVDSGVDTIATLNDMGEETEDNAYLIASAPELLKALEKLNGVISQNNNDYPDLQLYRLVMSASDKATQAIAKALPNPNPDTS